MRVALNGLVGLAVAAAVLTPVEATHKAEYRAFWVDTFNTVLFNGANVTTVVNNAVNARANAIVVQVRRRGDAWYRLGKSCANSAPPCEPVFPSIVANFDPLADLIAKAHAQGIEVHAFVIVGALWNRSPISLNEPGKPIQPVAAPPAAGHAFNLHGWNQATGSLYPAADNWLTRTLLPDTQPTPPPSGSTIWGPPAIGFSGHRFTSEFWLDVGHPDAAAYTVDVTTALVRDYDLDGLHLDRIRYPEFAAAGQTPSAGTSIGYNEVSVGRFQRATGLPVGSPNPGPGDDAWDRWRRNQVSNVVRRIYLNAIALKPQIKVSAALIAFGGTGLAESAWLSAEAYWRVYQDWRAWTEEGILDLAMPMNYKREHVAAQAAQYDQWNEWTKNHQYARAALVGQGAFLNSIEGTLPQTRRALAPSSTGQTPLGVIFFSMATSNVAVTNNPLAIPPATTPARSFNEFASGLKTGKSVSGSVSYENAATNPVPVFADAATLPVLPWKADPQVGHLKGVVRDTAGAIVDTGAIEISRVGGAEGVTVGRTLVAGETDGGGFYGGVDLAPGTYRVKVTPVGAASYTSCQSVAVTPGSVATLDITYDVTPPSATIEVTGAMLWPVNDKPRTMNVTGTATDAGGIASIQIQVIDEYDEVEPAIASVDGEGQPSLKWARAIELLASRRGTDMDGRTYRIVATVTDVACNVTTVETQVVVVHDQRVTP